MTEAQKKKLPSWIRDGLEKMEREKVKKEEEKERIRRTDEKKRKQREEETRLSKDPTASKFDNDLSEEEDERRESPPRKRKVGEKGWKKPPVAVWPSRNLKRKYY